MESIKYNIVTLGNGNKYFVYDEYKEDNRIYELIINVDEEADIQIVEQIEKGTKLILNEVENSEERKRILDIFKNNEKEID